MNTIAEIETAVPNLGQHEPTELAHFVGSMQLKPQPESKLNALDLPQLNLGAILEPTYSETNLMEEMLNHSRY
jgi:hypothetical protein